MKLKRNSGYVDVEFIVFLVCFFSLFAVGIIAVAHNYHEERLNRCKIQYMKTDYPIEDILKICS